MYDYLVDAIGAFWRYGASPTALVVALVALFKTKKVKRMISRRVPWLFRDDADVLHYQDRQIRIERDVRAIKAHLGVPACAESNDSLTSLANHSLKSSQAGGLFAQYANVHTHRELTTFSRGNRKMKNKFTSRKFLMAIISAALVIANDGLDLGLDQNTIIAFGSIVVAWIVGETAVDVAKKPEVPDASYTSREDSEGA